MGPTLLEFLAANGSMVLTTSSITGASEKEARFSSMRPASILDRSRMSLINASRWRPALSTRRNGSNAFSVPKRAALPTIMSVRPMIAFNGVRNSWLMLARNCDLC